MSRGKSPSNSALTTEKTAVAGPTPAARTRTTVTVLPRSRTSDRQAILSSIHQMSPKGPSRV